MGEPLKKQIDAKVLWLVVATDGRFHWTVDVFWDGGCAEKRAQDLTAMEMGRAGNICSTRHIVVKLDCFDRFDRIDPSALKSLGVW